MKTTIPLFLLTAACVFAEDSENSSGAIRNLPADPGREGMSTILGIDSDNDGVRDDLQRNITFAFPHDPYKRAAFMFLAKASRDETLVFQHNPECSSDDLMIHSQAIMAAAMYIIRSGAETELSIDDFEAMNLNTKERYAVQYELDGKFHGVTISSPLNDTVLRASFDTIFNEIHQREIERQKL